MKLIKYLRKRITLKNFRKRVDKIHSTTNNTITTTSNSKMGDIRSIPSSSSENFEGQRSSSTMDDPMKKESYRVGTFPQPPSDSDKELAAQGFFLNERLQNKIECYSCGARIDYPLKFPLSRIEMEHFSLNEECNLFNRLTMDTPARTTEFHGAQSTHVVNNNNNSHSNETTTQGSSDRQQGTPLASSSIPNNNRPESNDLETSRAAMKSEYRRLMTFKSVPPWPVRFIRPEDCARAGFYFLKEDDKVQCAFCRGVAGEWEPNDDPMEEHRRHFPRCPFILNVPVGNIPIGEDDDDLPVSSLLSIDICGPFDPSTFHLGPPDSARIRGAIPLAGSYDEVASNLSIKTCRGPSVLEMVTPQSRLKSFTDLRWPTSTGQDPEKMVEAGFYYTGIEDHVKCFYCDGGLRNWETDDDPWIEHAKWFPRCTFVVLHKGEAFIRAASQNEQQPQKESTSLSPSSTNSKSQATSPTIHVISSDEEEMEAIAGGSDVAGSSKTSSGVSSGFCSPTTSANSEGHESSSSGNSSGEEDETSAVAKASSREKALEEEVRKLTEAHRCKICMDNEVSVVFLPCGHLVSCTNCATAFNKCALCREPIKAFVRTYMS